jgi:hypothetical protein
MGPSCANPNCGDGVEWTEKPQECEVCSLPTGASLAGRRCSCGGDQSRYVDYQYVQASRRISAFDAACTYAKYTGGVARALSYVRPLTKGEVAAVPLYGRDTAPSTIVLRSDCAPMIRPNYGSNTVFPDEFFIHAVSTVDDRQVLTHNGDYSELLYLAIDNNNHALARREDEMFVSLLRTGAETFGKTTKHPVSGAHQRGFAHVIAKLLSATRNVECVVAGMDIHRQLVHDDKKMQVMFEGRMLYFTDTVAPLEFFAIRGRNVVSILERKFQVSHQTCSAYAASQIVTTLCESMVLAQPQLISHWEFV